MKSVRSRVVAPLVLALAVATATTLSGCVSFNPLEGIIEGATGTDVELPGTEIPEGFPSEVPITDGEVIFGGALGTDESGKAFSVSVRVSGPEVIETITSELEDAGFAPTEGLDAIDDPALPRTFSNDEWSVVVVVAEDADGYLANYIVTSAPAE